MVYVLIAIFLILFVVFLVSGIIFHLALNRNTSKESVLENDINSKRNENVKRVEPDIKWFNDNYNSVNIISNDNLKLVGYLNNNTNKWIILVHGYTSNHESMINRAKKFNELGYSTLLIDLRSHGNSEGKYITMGIKEAFDLKLWINYLIKEQKAKEIGLFGISMGAATVMTSLGLNLPKEVEFAIEDCGYTSVWDVLKYQLKSLYHLPAFPFLYICELYAKIFAKFDFKKYSSIKSLSKTNIPLLLIHGDEDTFVPYNMLDINYQHCNSYKEKLSIKNANHGEAEDLDYDKYWSTIKKFINRKDK